MGNHLVYYSEAKILNMTLQLTKALLVRGHPTSAKYTDKLFDLFNDPEIGWDAARAIGKVPKKDKVLTKQNHAVVGVGNILRYGVQLAEPIVHRRFYMPNGSSTQSCQELLRAQKVPIVRFPRGFPTL